MYMHMYMYNMYMDMCMLHGRTWASVHEELSVRRRSRRALAR
jgi:hypothetical protein